MVWSYPQISLQDLMELIKSFVDMLILASGYQSSGRLAHWDSHNIKKSFQWALFLENVSKGLSSSSDYEDSVKELDGALLELTSNPHFPKGLAHLSCATLGKATGLLLEHLIQTLPLRESHLKAILVASVEMIDDDSIDAFLEKRVWVPSQSLSLSQDGNFAGDSKVPFPEALREPGNSDDSHFSVLSIKQIRRRQLAVSDTTALENGLDRLWRTIGPSMQDELLETSNAERKKQMGSSITEELPVELAVWNCWRTRSLSYLLDRQTIRLVSGANLILSTPEGQWIKVFERLKISTCNDHLRETLEILLLGCVADKWSTLLEQLMSVSYESIPLSRFYQEVFNLPLGNPLNFCPKEGFISPKEKSAIDYLEILLSDHLDLLWELSPVLVAGAIPLWSQIFKWYLSGLEGQFHGNSLLAKRCSCIADGREHRECEVAERLWCLYIFHIRRTDAASRRIVGG